MVDLPELKESVSDSVRDAKTLISWLPDPFQCPECKVYCDATRAYDPQRAAFYPMGMAPSWKCPECNTEYVRE